MNVKVSADKPKQQLARIVKIDGKKTRTGLWAAARESIGL